MEQSDKNLNKSQMGLESHGATERSCASYCMEARCFRKSGQPAEALHLLEEGLRAFPDSIELHYEMGIALNMAGEAKKALESLERAVLLFSKNMNVLTSVAAIYKAQGEQSKAVNAYKVFLAYEQLLKIIEGQSSAIHETLSGTEPTVMNTGGLDTVTGKSDSQKALFNTLERMLEKVKARKRE